MTETDTVFVRLPNPYEGLTPDERAARFPDLDSELDPGSEAWATAVAASREDFDATVLPILLDPAQFLALSPLDRERAVVDFVTVHPEKHDQWTWVSFFPDRVAAEGEDNPEWFVGAEDTAGYFLLETPRPDRTLSCGTAACVAGWVTTFAGDTLTASPGELDGYSDGHVAVSAVTPAGRSSHETIGQRARDLLGYLGPTPPHLFTGSNTLAELRGLTACRERHELPAG